MDVASPVVNLRGSESRATRVRLSDLSETVVQKALYLRGAGSSLREIAADLGLSHGSVQRLLKREDNGGSLEPSPARLPRRPRNGQSALPDFEKLAKETAKGKTVKELWQAYARGTSRPYSYEYFSTLFRVWLDENKVRAPQRSGHQASESPATQGTVKEIPDYTADEDYAAETFWKDRVDPRSVIHVIFSHGCSVKVHRGDLVTYDSGIERRFSKVLHGLKALLVIGQSGSLTLDAIRWCEAQGVAICVLDWYGELVSVTQPALKTDVAIRRAQFGADRLAVAKAVLIQKTKSQARIGKLSAATLRKALADARRARSVEELLTVEAQAALEYWSNWTFELKHRKRNWPDQWTLFAYRASPISGGTRHAMHPVNAILNYAYSVAAAQITRTLQASGFDSAAGFLHADADGRHSLTYDVLELLRADIDNAILPWVASHMWKRPDFPVTPEGVVRLQPTLAAVVAQRAIQEQKKIDATVDCLADWLRQRS